MTKILVINSGSTSVKFQLFEASGTHYEIIAKGLAERIGINDSLLTVSIRGSEKQTFKQDLPDHETALKAIINALLNGAVKSLAEISAVGHRLGLGGEYFDKSVIIDKDVMDKIYDTVDFLPLHGKAFVRGIEAVTAMLPEITQVATFDSAFHQTMPKEAFLYALPYEQYEKHHIRRYGYHGTSHKYVAEEAARMLGHNGKFITCHLGGGASITAIDNGRSIDTSMGFTPAAVILLGTRSGDIYPYFPIHIMKTQNKTADEVNAMLNKESGLYGLSGGYSDLRDIEARYLAGDEKAITAIDVYVHSILKYIGGFIAVLGGIDALIFTAGAGENSSFLRKKICDRLTWLGITLDETANRRRGEAVAISTPDSRVAVLVIPTNEELMIARDTYQLIAAETQEELTLTA